MGTARPCGPAGDDVPHSQNDQGSNPMQTQMTEVTMPEAVDHVQPDGKWSFNDDVAKCFDDMLIRSIPQHSVMRQAVFDVGSRYVQKETAIIDLGCSRGEAL